MRFLPACAALVCLAYAQQARAYEDQLTLGIGAGYAHAVSDALPRHGALLDVSVSTGLGPAWSLRGRASYAVHPDDRAVHAMLLDADLLYLIDVLEIVPYFGLGAGGLGRARSGQDFELDANAHAVLGLDYLISRTLTLELDLRPYLIVSELDRDPFYFAVSAGLVFMFDG